MIGALPTFTGKVVFSPSERARMKRSLEAALRANDRGEACYVGAGLVHLDGYFDLDAIAASIIDEMLNGH